MGAENRTALLGGVALLAIILMVTILAGAIHSTPQAGPVVTPTPAPPRTYQPGTGVPENRGSFVFTISPKETQARPGETLMYMMEIQPADGFNDTVQVSLVVSALFVTRNYDLGSYEPPFPRRIEYPFTVPTSIPSGITIEGKLTAEGGRVRREEIIHLRVV